MQNLIRILRDIDACTTDSILGVGDEGTVQIPLKLLRELKAALRTHELPPETPTNKNKLIIPSGG